MAQMTTRRIGIVDLSLKSDFDVCFFFPEVCWSWTIRMKMIVKWRSLIVRIFLFEGNQCFLVSPTETSDETNRSINGEETTRFYRLEIEEKKTILLECCRCRLFLLFKEDNEYRLPFIHRRERKNTRNHQQDLSEDRMRDDLHGGFATNDLMTLRYSATLEQRYQRLRKMVRNK